MISIVEKEFSEDQFDRPKIIVKIFGKVLTIPTRKIVDPPLFVEISPLFVASVQGHKNAKKVLKLALRFSTN